MTKQNRSEPADKGTRQTRARLREGTVERLVKSGKIGVDEQSAAAEIEYVYSRLASDVAGKISSYGEYTDPGERPDWPWRMQEAYRKRYLPWVNQLQSIQSLRENGPAFEVARAVCCFGVTARDVDRAFQRRKGTSQKQLIFALQEYCYIAGWLKRPIPFHTPERKSA